ncbi:MAG: hypothetical protein ACXWAT_17175 [Methylobacter sp.]
MAVIANKAHQNLPAVFVILLFLKGLLSHFTGKTDTESGKVGTFYTFSCLVHCVVHTYFMGFLSAIE